MLTTTDKDLQDRLGAHLDDVHKRREPLLVTRSDGTASVIIDKEDWDGLMETVHLLRSPANAARLLKSIADADAGKLDQQELKE